MLDTEILRTEGPSDNTSGEVSGKFLTFFLDEEEYGLEILAVREIIGLLPTTPIPHAPSHLRGIINRRGEVIPVMDLRSRFRMHPVPDTDESCIIVVQTQGATLGIVVDRVSEVRDIPAEAIVHAPALSGVVRTDYLTGVGKLADRVTLLLDIGEVFPLSDLQDLAGWPD